MPSISSNIIWSAAAQNGFHSIIDYLESQFSEKVAQKFIDAFYEQISIILKHPNAFPLVENSTYIRRALVLRLTSILYTVKENKIFLYSVYDNRQLPPKI